MNRRFTKIDSSYNFIPETGSRKIVIDPKDNHLVITLDDYVFKLSKRDIKRFTSILELAAEDM